MFYTYDQNNSGGWFDVNEEAGVSCYVIVEANSAEEANEKAKEIGLYFDGVEEDIDCECCGDRWYEVYEDDGEETPKIYGKEVEEYEPTIWWPEPGQPVVYVHRANGKIEPYHFVPGVD